MSLWCVWGLMGSPLELLGTSFWDPRGVIFGALGGHFGSFLVHFGSLGGSLGDFWGVWGQTKAIYPQDILALFHFRGKVA